MIHCENSKCICATLTFELQPHGVGEYKLCFLHVHFCVFCFLLQLQLITSKRRESCAGDMFILHFPICQFQLQDKTSLWPEYRPL